MENLGSFWTHFHTILYLKIFLKSDEKSQVLLKSWKDGETKYVLSSVHFLRWLYRLGDNMEKTQNTLLCFHCKNNYTKAPQCCYMYITYLLTMDQWTPVFTKHIVGLSAVFLLFFLASFLSSFIKNEYISFTLKDVHFCVIPICQLTTTRWISFFS